MFNKNTILISVGIVFREQRGKSKWLLVKKTEDADWEFPRITVRKTESSARGALRMSGELLGATVQIIEEVGRSGGMTNVNGRSVSQRQLYYLLKLHSQDGEALGFSDSAFFEYAQATKKLASKRDQQMLKNAKVELKKYLEKKDKRPFVKEVPIEIAN